MLNENHTKTYVKMLKLMAWPHLTKHFLYSEEKIIGYLEILLHLIRVCIVYRIPDTLNFILETESN